MRFDKTGDDKLIRDIVLGSLRTDADRNLGDAPLRDADVDDLRLASGDADIAKDQVEGHVVKRHSCQCPKARRFAQAAWFAP